MKRNCTHRALPLAVLVTAVGCEQTNMAQSWQLDRLRILGVRAEVDGGPDPVLGYRAEPRPGERALFTSLLYVPEDVTWEGTTWLACLPEDASQAGCVPDPDVLEELEAVYAELEAAQTGEVDTDLAELEELFEQLQTLAMQAGFIGQEPDLPPAWDIPEDALDDLNENERLEGKSAFISITVIPEGAEDESDMELAFKQVPVSEATTPNHNPDIIDVSVAGLLLKGAGGFNAERGLTYKLEPILSDHHLETYAYKREDGTTEWRVEQPYFSWYTEAGHFDQEISLHPYSEVEWKAPKKKGPVTLYVVARDRRGGMGWRQIVVNVL